MLLDIILTVRNKCEGMEGEEEEWVAMGGMKLQGRAICDASEEIMLLWGLLQPLSSKQNAFVNHNSNVLSIDACGHHLNILQSPSCMNDIGVTGGVMWDSGVVLAKFLEHAIDCNVLRLKDKKCVELGAGCGLTGCIAALLGAHVILTDLDEHLKLLEKNVAENVKNVEASGTAAVKELTWGDELDFDLAQPLPDYVFGSDVVYDEDVVPSLIDTIEALCTTQTIVFIAGELRNDAVLECFLEHALQTFEVAFIDQSMWHPDYRSNRVAVFMMVKKVVEGEI